MDKIVVLNWYEVVIHLRNLFNNPIYIGLLVLIVLDIITGKSKAILCQEIDSSVGTKGMIKHTTIIILNTVVGVVVGVFDLSGVGNIFGIFYAMEYITSILENLDVLGIPFPDNFKKNFIQMRQNNDKKEL